MADQHNIGLLVPRFEEFTDFCQAAGRLGFHSLWATEGVFQSGRMRDPFAVLDSAAAATSRIRLGAGILWTFMRDPAAFAGRAAHLDRLSSGRLTVCVSQGNWPGEGRTSRGMWLREGGRVEEAIKLMNRLWTEDGVTF